MDTDLITPYLTGFRSIQTFAYFFMSSYDEDEFYPELRNSMYYAPCPHIAILASELYDKLLLNEFSEIDFLDFLDSLANEYKIGVLTLNGINAIDDELLVLLKDLGEEKVLKTLCTDEFMDDYLSFN